MRQFAVCLSCLVALSASKWADAASGYTAQSTRIGPPVGHHNLGDVGESTASWIERTSIWEGAGSVELDAFVDSQDGADRLEIWLDGTPQIVRSGFHQGGHLSLPVTAGSHTVRFVYVKDASIDVGLDTAWVDSVRFVSNTAIFENHHFNNAVGCEVAGWVPGGHSGGWCATLGPEKREWHRPEAMAHVGYRPTRVYIALERSFVWPSDTNQNELAVEYVVDSEAANDYFQVLVDGVASDPISGRDKHGYLRIPVGAGTHHVMLMYSKDESIDEGFDEARIRAIEIRSRGVTIGFGGLDGSTVGEVPRGWIASTSDPSAPTVHWSATHRKVSPIQLPSNETLRVADGSINPEEYQARLDLWDAFAGVQSKLWLGATTSEHFILGLELPPPLGDWFRADGKIAIMIDAMRPSAPIVLDCGPEVNLPGPSARRIEIASTAEGGHVVSEKVGTCGASGGTWRDATSAESWPLSTAVVESDTSGGMYLELEIGVSSPSGLGELSPLAFGLTAESPMVGSAGQSFLRYPDAAIAHFDESDTSTWRVVRRWPKYPTL